MITHISSFRKMSLGQLEKLTPEKIKFFEEDSIEENYTIVIRPPSEITRELITFISSFNQIDPNQFFYPSSQLHLTILGRLKSSINEEKIIRALEVLLPQYPLEFDLWGCGSNEFCASVSAYPSMTLCTLRQKLRKMIGDKGDDYSVHLPLYEHVGWINFMRYLQEPPQKLLNALLNTKDIHFGTMKVNQVEIYKNTSKTLDPKKIQLIGKVSV